VKLNECCALTDIRVLAALCAACSSTRLRAHSPVWIPCKPPPFRVHCSDPPLTCFRATTPGTARNRFLRGPVAMSSLRQLDADQPQTYCPRVLLIVRATRYFLNQPATIGSISCFLARSQSCVSDHRFISCTAQRLFTSSRTYDYCLVRTLSTCTPAYTEARFGSRSSTKGRLNLHTRPAPPAASF